MDDRAQRFTDTARPRFGTVSGNATTGLRIAVRNVTAYRQLAAIVEQYQGVISPTPARYPALVTITFPRTCDRCGALKPIGQSCPCFDNGSE